MVERLLETDFPLMAPPNPPGTSLDTGRNGSLRRAYEAETVSEVTPLRRAALDPDTGSDTSDYLSDPGPPGYTTLPPGKQLGRQQTFVVETRQRRHTDEDEVSLGTKCCFWLFYLLAQIFLHGALALLLFWVCVFRWDKDRVTETGEARFPTPFLWRGGGGSNEELEYSLNLHPVLMVAGLVYLGGQALLLRTSWGPGCCRPFVASLVHALLQLVAVPCLVLAFMAVWDYKALRADNSGQPRPVPHFYSIHSWLGLGALGMFAIQLMLNLLSVLALLLCEGATLRFRARLRPVTNILAAAAFTLAVAAAVCGLTEIAFLNLSTNYFSWLERYAPSVAGLLAEQSIPLFLNVTAASLGLLAILLPLLLWYPRFNLRIEVD